MSFRHVFLEVLHRGLETLSLLFLICRGNGPVSPVHLPCRDVDLGQVLVVLIAGFPEPPAPLLSRLAPRR